MIGIFLLVIGCVLLVLRPGGSALWPWLEFALIIAGVLLIQRTRLASRRGSSGEIGDNGGEPYYSDHSGWHNFSSRSHRANQHDDRHEGGWGGDSGDGGGGDGGGD